MPQIAVLLTCFNRKANTLAALNSLFKAHDLVKNTIDITVYLTDDNSTDGTGESIRKDFPQIKILEGNGELYWAGGMRKAWKLALKNNYDSYLLLNDDTEVFENLFEELNSVHEYSINKYQRSGIYIGSTLNPKTNKISYGGSVYTSTLLSKFELVAPNQIEPQNCDLGAANIMLVSKEIVGEIGIIEECYVHSFADWDYTLKAKKNNIPALIAAGFLGTCLDENKNPYSDFHQLSFKDRLHVLRSPLGLDFKSHLYYTMRNFPYRLPVIYLSGWFKLLFPTFFYNIFVNKKVNQEL